MTMVFSSVAIWKKYPTIGETVLVATCGGTLITNLLFLGSNVTGIMEYPKELLPLSFGIVLVGSYLSNNHEKPPKVLGFEHLERMEKNSFNGYEMHP